MFLYTKLSGPLLNQPRLSGTRVGKRPGLSLPGLSGPWERWARDE